MERSLGIGKAGIKSLVLPTDGFISRRGFTFLRPYKLMIISEELLVFIVSIIRAPGAPLKEIKWIVMWWCDPIENGL